MIKIRGVHKKFGALQVLSGVDVTIQPGAVTAMVGPNAAGKTTLMKSVLGLTRIDSGSITVGDTLLNGDWDYRRRIGYMAQIARFPDNLTAAELFDLIRDLRGQPKEDSSADLIQALSLTEELRKPLRTLSGGTRQKVSATIALMFNAEILILDEPSAGLDPASSRFLKDQIVTRRDQGKTIIMTSHIMSEIDELADRIVYLLDGKVMFDGTKDELKSRARHDQLDRAVATLLEGTRT